MRNIRELQAVQAEWIEDTMDAKERFRFILAKVFDARFSPDELFDKLDTDHSGRVSWEQFWGPIEMKVDQSATPILKHLFTERCAENVYQYKEYLRGLWEDKPELEVKYILGGLKRHKELAALAEQLTTETNLYSDSATKLTFDAVWQDIEESTVSSVKADLVRSMSSDVDIMRNGWRDYFYSIFQMIDKAGSGTISKSEFVDAYRNMQNLGSGDKATTAATATHCTMWRQPEVVLWLGQLGLGQYAAKFEEQAMDGRALLSLKDTRDRSLSFPDFQAICESATPVRLLA